MENFRKTSHELADEDFSSPSRKGEKAEGYRDWQRRRDYLR
jgi:hypothetical protein